MPSNFGGFPLWDQIGAALTFTFDPLGAHRSIGSSNTNDLEGVMFCDPVIDGHETLEC